MSLYWSAKPTESLHAAPRCQRDALKSNSPRARTAIPYLPKGLRKDFCAILDMVILAFLVRDPKVLHLFLGAHYS